MVRLQRGRASGCEGVEGPKMLPRDAEGGAVPERDPGGMRRVGNIAEGCTLLRRSWRSPDTPRKPSRSIHPEA